MRLKARTLLAVAALTLAALAPAAGLKWAKSFNAALAQAKKTKGYVMVDFTAVWCVNCHKLDRTTYKDPSVIRLLAHATPVRIDFDTQQALAKKYKVKALPVILFLDRNGKEVGRISKYVTGPEFVKTATPIIKKAGR